MSRDFESVEGEFDTSHVLARTLSALAEGLTGIAASERTDWALSIGRILQSIRGGRLLKAFAAEWNAYREKGRIKDDYVETEQHQECLQELLDFLDEGPPDAARFATLKKILLVAATESVTSRESFLPQQYMGICRDLSSGELLVMLTAYSVSKAPPSVKLDRPESARTWLQSIAQSSGLQYIELVENHERLLIEKNLLTDRVYPDRSGVSIGQHFRLTELAYAICRYIDEYDDLLAA